MEPKCPKCGHQLTIQDYRYISDTRAKILLTCKNCGMYFDFTIELNKFNQSEFKVETKIDMPLKKIDLTSLPLDAPDTLKILIKESNDMYIPFYWKKIMQTPPLHGNTDIFGFFNEIGVGEKKVQKLLEHLYNTGIKRLYRFQEESIKHIIEGKNVLITAPTGTGKTEAFAIPSFLTALKSKKKGERKPSVLIIYPTKALARDQLSKLMEYASVMDLSIGVLDGDTPKNERYRIIRNPPDILITNFDMINYHISYRTKLADLFTRASILIMDEAHKYQGAFGTHVYYILKRLKRLIAKNGKKLQLVMSSATISNPKEFARVFMGEDSIVIKEDGRKTPLYVLFIYPTESIYRTIANITAKMIQYNFKVLAFLNSRKNAELTLFYLKKSEKKMPFLNSKFDIHRAGLDREIRMQIEKEFRNGIKLGLISTPTLELGIDIGDLDVVISEIAPIDNFIQRSGRAGRRNKPGLAVLILRQEDPISNYYARRPEDYFNDKILKYIEPNNRYIAEMHTYLMAYDDPIDLKEVQEVNLDEEIIKNLIEKGSLVMINKKLYANKMHFKKYFPRNIRGSDKIIRVYYGNKLIDEREAVIGIRELHEGAIYMNRGKKYIVESLDLDRMIARVTQLDSTYDPLYTKPLYSYSATPIKILEEKNVMGTRIYHGLFRMKAIVSGYLIFREGFDKPVYEKELRAPIIYEYETYGLAFKAPDITLADKEDVAGTYHATEHILIEGTNSITGGGAEDLGGISFGTTGIIVIYDGTPGGNGVSKLLFDRFEIAIRRSFDMLKLCRKPSLEDFNKCVYSYRCGNNNKPLYAPGAFEVLDMMIKNVKTPDSDHTVDLLKVLDRGYV